MSAVHQQQHGRLLDHKLVVKSWNAGQQRGFLRPIVRGEKSESDARTMQWLCGETSSEREEDLNVVRSDVLPYEESLCDAEELRRESDDDEVETCPRTVGQIKHAYRTRARKEERMKEHRAFDAARKQKERLKQYAPQVKTPVKAFDSHAPTETELLPPTAEPTEPANTMDEREAEDPNEFALDASALVHHAPYRESMLREIRRHLSSGRNALLSVRLALADASEDLSTIKLALQQLCSESLLFCVRDQNVLASVDRQRGVVTLELFTRQPLQCT